MTLSSASFLFFFLPAALIAYFALPSLKAKNVLLVLLSLLFYAGGSLTALAVLVLSAVACYVFGLLIGKNIAPRAVGAVAVVVFLLILCTFKYLNFIISGLNLFPGVSLAPTNLIVPAGVSFFTFREISYIVDAGRDRRNASASFLEVLLYVSFFPQLLCGPITRFGDFAPQVRSRTHSLEKAATGLRRVVLGLAKKLLLAGLIADIADAAFGMEAGALDARLAWLGAVAYTLQIYFDFSGYSDMAIGLGTIFGFTTPENFNYPYISSDITEFWRRWHISLSSWLKDYVYIPLGGNRKGKARQALNKAMVFLVCGLWHGAGLNFILWGAWHGLLSLLETLGVLKTKVWKKTRAGNVICHVYTLLAVVLGFVLFRAADLAEAGKMLGAMFSAFRPTSLSTLALQRIGLTSWMAMILGMVCCTPLGKKLWLGLEERSGVSRPVSYVLTALLLVLCLLCLAGGGFTPFIYAQF